MTFGKFLTDIIGEYIEKVRYEDLPGWVIEKVKLCVLDSIRCMLGGVVTSLGKTMIKSLLACDHGDSTIVGHGRNASLLTAVYINSTLANILDYDDTYIGHPGATIIPTALNIGELLHSSGKEIVVAIALGYEVATRFGLGLRPTMERRYVHGHGSWQAFGACVVAGKLLHLSADEMANALSITAANAPVPSVMKTVYGLTGPTPCKNNFGIASVVGMLSSLLARGGFRGPKDIFEGDTGFWRMIGTDQCKLDKEFESLGRKYEIMNVAFKPYPCCRLIHSSIDAVLECIKRYNIKASTVKRVVVRTISTLCKPPFTNHLPKDMFEAQFSAPYAIACAVHSIESIDTCIEANLRDSEIVSFAEKIFLEAVPEYDEEFQRDPGKIPAEAIIYTRDNEYKCKVEIPRGDPRNPLSKEEIVKRFEAMAFKALRRENKVVTLVVNTVLKLEKLSNIGDLTVLLT